MIVHASGAFPRTDLRFLANDVAGRRRQPMRIFQFDMYTVYLLI